MMNKLYLLDTSFLKDDEKFLFWYRKMDQDRKNKIDAFKVQSGKRTSLGAGILIKRALEEVGIYSFELESGEHGKPRLKGSGSVFFNLSHTEDMVILGISDKEIGVDIEKNNHFDDSLIEYVFNRNEIALAEREVRKENKTEKGTAEAVDGISSLHKVYTRFWTIKESIMKHSGRGVLLEPKMIEIFSDGGRFRAKAQGYDCENLYLTCTETGDYQITVCSSYEGFPDATVICLERI